MIEHVFYIVLLFVRSEQLFNEAHMYPTNFI